jgi:hypothetical protein
MSAMRPSLTPLLSKYPALAYEALSDADVAEADRQIKEFGDTGMIACPSPGAYFKIRAVLRERWRVHVLAGEVSEATEIDDLIREVSQFFEENKLYVAKAEHVAICEAQYETERARLEEAQAKWGRELQTLIRQRDAVLGRSADTGRQYLGDFDAAVPSTLPPEFTRLSANLLELREREKRLIASRRFEEARQAHKEFEQRQKEELVKRREEYFVHLERERAELERRNARKTSAIVADWTRKINHFKHSMEGELKPLRDGVSNLLTKLTIAKAEYVGEDDPILNNDTGLSQVRQSGNIFRTSSPAFTRAANPRSIVATRRPIERPVTVASTRMMSKAMCRQTYSYDGRHWPQ